MGTGTRPPGHLRGGVDGFPLWSPWGAAAGAAPAGRRSGDSVRRETLDRCLSWLEPRVHWFGDGWDDFFPPREVPESTILELLLLCRILRRGPRAEETRRFVETVVSTAESMAARPVFLDRLCGGGPGLGYRIWLLALLRDLGRPVPEPFETAHRVLAAHGGDLRGPDWSAPHALELRYILDLAGLPQTLPSAQQLYEDCGLSRIDPLTCTENEVYAFTHVLFYASDFGEWPLPAAERDQRKLRETLETILGVHIAVGHFDLAAELLMCAGIVGGGPPELVEFGWRRVAAAQRADGSLPGPPFQEAVLAEREGDRAESYVFRTCYHTTLVTAMALAEGERHR